MRIGAMDVAKPYRLYKVWGHVCHQRCGAVDVTKTYNLFKVWCAKLHDDTGYIRLRTRPIGAKMWHRGRLGWSGSSDLRQNRGHQHTAAGALRGLRLGLRD